MKPRARILLTAGLIALGVGQIAFVSIASIRSHLLERASRSAVTGAETRPGNVAHAALSRSRAMRGGPIGHLEIVRLGIRAPVVEGVGDEDLLMGVGHVPGSAFPGEPDNAALAGHRDTHFARLRDVRPGDMVRIGTADGVFLYEVDTAFVVTPERSDLMKPTGRAMLTLITCYPFRWIGTAPKRFIVLASAA